MKRFRSGQILCSPFKSLNLITKGSLWLHFRSSKTCNQYFGHNLQLKSFYSSTNSMGDKVHIENLRVNSVIGPDSWNQLSPQQCFITMNMHTDFSKASAGDDLRYSLNYATVSKEIESFVESKKNWQSLGNLSRSISEFALQKFPGISNLQLQVKTKTGHIRTDSISCLVDRNIDDKKISSGSELDYIQISNLRLLTLIGVFSFERLQKQFVTVDIRLPWPKLETNPVLVKEIINDVVSYIENSTFLTVEALVDSTAKIVGNNTYYKKYDVLPIEIKIIKLNAITNTSGVGVSTNKRICDLKSLRLQHLSGKKTPNDGRANMQDVLEIFGTEKSWNTAYLAFGSNMSDKVGNVRTALGLLDADRNVKVQSVSSLFESEPMYFKDQESFVNGCVKISTSLMPHDLLKLCKNIEYKELGRIKHFDNCPRVVDLDIIMYCNNHGEQMLLNAEDLVIPHPRLLERSFVLEPLCELVPPNMTHPVTTQSIVEHLNQIYEKENKEDILSKIIALPSYPFQHNCLKFKNVRDTDNFFHSVKTISKTPTLLMGILNTTPDSFSDGNHDYLDLEKQLQNVKKMCAEALQLQTQVIIDIGGCSTRPKSEQVSEEDELRRTIHVIESVRKCKDLPQDRILLSIDTYRSTVAKAAILAGIDIVNDISGGKFDPKMFDVIASNPNVAYVLSHIRGNISNMVSMNQYETSKNTIKEYINDKACSDDSSVLIRTVGYELAQRYNEALKKGIARSQIIMDPGIGFAKNGKQNLELIKQLPLLKNYSCILGTGEFVNFRNIPILVGPSRKSFIGEITGDLDPKDRDFGTYSLVSSCVGFGADIVRIHDVAGCSKVLKMADAIYKGI